MTSPAATAVHERIDPVFFTGRASRLYGCHHMPTVASSPSAVVLCAPAGHEYTRCHRAMRQLAAQLARAGHHAFRFDYSGTGDSGGEYAQASLATWRQDACDAMDECRRRTRALDLTLVGLRLGAAIALQAAGRRTDVRSLVLWNPVIDGAAMLREWRSAHRAFATAFGYPPDPTDDQVLGMPLHRELAADLEALDGPAGDASVDRMLVCHDRAADADVDRLVSRLKHRVRKLDVRVVEQPAIWRQESLEAIVPFQALRAIVDWLRAPA